MTFRPIEASLPLLRSIKNAAVKGDQRPDPTQPAGNKFQSAGAKSEHGPGGKAMGNFAGQLYSLSLGHSLKNATPEQKKDKAYVMNIVGHNGVELEYADDSLKKDPDVVMAAVKQNGGALQFADIKLRGDRTIVLAAVRQNGAAICYADQFKQLPVLEDREIVSTAMETYPDLYTTLPDKMKQNKDLLLKYVSANPKNIRNLDPVYRRDPEVVRAVIGGDLPLEYAKALIDLGIEFPERLRGATPAQVAELIDTRRDFKNDGRPLALVVLPKKDWNGAFANNKVLELMGKGYHVVLVEAGKETDLYSAITGYGGKQKISLLWIGGHGTPGTVNFGSAPNAQYDETDYLDLADRREMKKLGLGDFMEKDSVVVLQSCSTGRGREGKFNISNMLGEVFTHSTVYAPEQDAFISDLSYDSDNHVSGVVYGESVPTYSSYPLSMGHPERIINYVVDPGSLGDLNLVSPPVGKFFNKSI
ncbi:MAG TPA: DUF4116 domain-containing protein [Candidatus Omnitrophota bacterium]|nr:DUF4116 domain-containing protein [Candidatus Omnitrophota bacterium]